jgi:hypothetical protein
MVDIAITVTDPDWDKLLPSGCLLDGLAPYPLVESEQESIRVHHHELADSDHLTVDPVPPFFHGEFDRIVAFQKSVVDDIKIRHMDLEVQPSAKGMFKLSSDPLPILHELPIGYFIERVDLLKHQGGAAQRDRSETFVDTLKLN